MASHEEKFDKEERAKRLREARKLAGLAGPKAVYDASNGAISIDTFKAHDSGRNGFSVSEGRRYADLFGVSLIWLYLGIGDAKDTQLPGATPELKRVFAKLVDAPDQIQNQVMSLARFLLAEANTPGQLPQGHSHDQSADATPRHEVKPSRKKAGQQAA